MEYIIIDKDSIKVTVDKSELSFYGLNVQTLDYTGKDAKRLFEDILEYANKNLDFDASNRKVFVEFFPLQDGGCRLNITKLDMSELIDIYENDDCEENGNEEKFKPKIYRFNSLNDLILVSKILDSCGFSSENTAYFDEDMGWFLSLQYKVSEEEFEHLFLSPVSVICEYAKPENSEIFSQYLSEHARKICSGNAVKTLSTL